MAQDRAPSREPKHDSRVDKAAEDSFPASDPPPHSAVTGVANDRDRIAEAAQDDRRARPPAESGDIKPKGSPTSDRYATETAQRGAAGEA